MQVLPARTEGMKLFVHSGYVADGLSGLGSYPGKGNLSPLLQALCRSYRIGLAIVLREMPMPETISLFAVLNEFEPVRSYQIISPTEAPIHTEGLHSRISDSPQFSG